MSEGRCGEQISPDGNWRWDGHTWVPNDDAPGGVDNPLEITEGEAFEVVAQLDCSSDTAAVGQVVTLSCYSGDEVPAAYDKITIADSY
ncbi:hypothetical protein NSZ01_17570 [Nocardioides szechwanensis]|uniref:Uncharacterized protein n=1 Tax=Nocardioides szechwanensis TaxID=1005944 RepID=A0A1G9ZMN3_9ACTN|nr:hypothetical protein [Nocardioides szechwanensis]GEP33989.1 hypothetical protein NSZ01_17570 [Nocardioides szechwanensis]SDN22608.1 hypothetical protein SAMN05192576_1786 [Nocardioides szechwanensis]